MKKKKIGDLILFDRFKKALALIFSFGVIAWKAEYYGRNQRRGGERKKWQENCQKSSKI